MSTSVQLDSVPSSPDISSVASRSMLLDPSPSPPPTPPPEAHEQSEPAQSPPPDDPIPAVVIEMQEAETSRYSLRQRSAAQKQPFTVEDLRYRNQLKAMPEAIVKLRNVPRGDGNHDPQNGNGQGNQDEAFVPPAEDEERDRTSRDRRKKQPRSADDILNELDESQEEKRKRRAQEKDERARKKEARAKLKDERRRRREEREELKRQKEQRRKDRAERKAIREHTTATSNSGADAGPSVAFDSQDPDNGDYLIDLYGRDPPSDEELANTVKTEPHGATRNGDAMDVISVSSDSEEAPSRPSSPVPSESSESDGEDSQERNLRKAVHTLCKTMPPGLAISLLEAQPPPRQSKHVPTYDDGAPLLPGQSRKRKVGNGGDMREIRGDSESELEMSDNPEVLEFEPAWSPPESPGPSKPSRSAKSSRPRKKKKGKVAGLVNYDSSDQSDLEAVDDQTIDRFVVNRPGTYTEATMINYMLQRTRVFKEKGDREKEKKFKGKRRSKLEGKKLWKDKKPGYRHDIVTSGARGMGHEHQALISNFDGYGHDTGSGKKHHQRQDNRAASSTSRHREFSAGYGSDADDDSTNGGTDTDDVDPEVVRREAQQRAKRQKEKARRAAMKTNGITLVKPKKGGKAKVSAGKPRHFLPGDLEVDAGPSNELFPQPKVRQWDGPIHRRAPSPDRISPLDALRDARQSRSSPAAGLDLFADDNDSPDSPIAVDEDEDVDEISVVQDSGIPLLRSGNAFNLESYIRKGWLRELTLAVNPASKLSPLVPLRVHLHTYRILPDATVDGISQSVKKACEDMFDFASGIPDPDQLDRVDDWTHIIHHLGQAISHRLPQLDENSRSNVKDAIGTEVTRLILRLKSLQLSTPDSLDLPLFQAHWLAVELTARIGGQILNDRGDLTASPVVDSIQLLIHHLLLLGLDKTMQPVLEDLETKALSEVTVPTFSAQMWVRLIHLLSEYDQLGHPRKRGHIFWQFVLSCFKTFSENQPDFVLFETLWKATFSLCALSQFSISGMALSKPTLPAAWDVVTFLCDGTFKQMETQTLEQDYYIRHLLSRWFILNERWSWKILDVSSLVKLVVDKVFAPRRFVSLEDEVCEFPRFLRHPEVDGLSTVDPKDSAYVILLKFIFRASKEESAKPFSIKKLISLSEPVSAVQFDTMTVADTSMIINRICAAIVGVRVNPSTYESRVNQVRNSIDFTGATFQTRVMLIRSLYYWARFIIHHEPDLSIEKLAPWANSMAGCLANKWKIDKDNELGRTKLLAKLLLGAVSKLYEIPGAPEPSLITALKPLFHVAREDAEAQNDARRILTLAIDRWYEAVPPPRPAVPKKVVQVEEEESQDLFGNEFADIDWASCDIPEALAGDIPPGPSAPDPVPLKQAIADTRINWLAYRAFKECVVKEELVDALKLCSTWVGCKLLAGLDEQEMKGILDLTKGVLEEKAKVDGVQSVSEPFKRKFDVIVWVSILERCPIVYQSATPSLDFKERFLGSFFHALVSVDDWTLSLFKLYASRFLSVDQLQHPLLQGCQTSLPPPDPDSGAYRFTRDQFIECRVGVLETIFNNLDASVASGNLDISKLRLVVKNTFSVMRNNLVNMTEHTETFDNYVAFGLRVVESLNKTEHLSKMEAMTFWKSWAPGGGRS
ncbi:hypothetical protein EST38_g3469 [Candolleomyces aberdarensis]|uniref:Uncharacterized protein n=1 Tax=Candolleomyces aberdarensis TaxID=2316362 RepID=A0A4Q2DQI1_9AGAR|nr:hypothetical protein EST38_g3469 [Candolleomyces aberdarensis]